MKLQKQKSQILFPIIMILAVGLAMANVSFVILKNTQIGLASQDDTDTYSQVVDTVTATQITTYEELVEQISINTTTELVMMNDISVPNDTSISIPAGKDITIDLNGHILSGRSTLQRGSVLIANNGKLTIKDTTDVTKVGAGSGKVDFFAEQPDTRPVPGYASNTMNNTGSFVLESGLLANITSTPMSGAANAIDNSSGAEITINGGKVYTAAAVGVRLLVTSSTADNKLTMNGGIIEGGFGLQLQVTNAVPKSTIVINSGEIKSPNDTAFYVYDASQQENGVQIEVNGGSFTAPYPLYVYTAFGDIEVNNGNFAGGDTAFYYYDAHNTATPGQSSGKIAINGGNFTTSVADGTPLYLYNNYTDLEINNGTFTGDCPIYYYASRDAGKVTTTVNGGTFNGDYSLFYAGYISDPASTGPSYAVINDGNFSGDIYMYGYNASGWFFDRNVQFINGGYFAEKDGMYWPLYIKKGLHATNAMRTAPEGFPYTIGYEVNLKANYEGGQDEIIYTIPNGQLSELRSPSREGYNFTGWNTEPDGSGTVVTADSIIDQDRTFYAQWQVITPVPPAPDPTPVVDPDSEDGDILPVPKTGNTGGMPMSETDGTVFTIGLVAFCLGAICYVVGLMVLIYRKIRR